MLHLACSCFIFSCVFFFSQKKNICVSQGHQRWQEQVLFLLILQWAGIARPSIVQPSVDDISLTDVICWHFRRRLFFSNFNHASINDLSPGQQTGPPHPRGPDPEKRPAFARHGRKCHSADGHIQTSHLCSHMCVMHYWWPGKRVQSP